MRLLVSLFTFVNQARLINMELGFQRQRERLTGRDVVGRRGQRGARSRHDRSSNALDVHDGSVTHQIILVHFSLKTMLEFRSHIMVSVVFGMPLKWLGKTNNEPV